MGRRGGGGREVGAGKVRGGVNRGGRGRREEVRRGGRSTEQEERGREGGEVKGDIK